MLRGESQESFAVIQLHPPTLGYRSFVLVSVESKSAALSLRFVIQQELPVSYTHLTLPTIYSV